MKICKLERLYIKKNLKYNVRENDNEIKTLFFFQDQTVATILLHPEYDPFYLTHNIAILIVK